MKVYVAEREYYSEGFVILGVYSSEEKAKARCDADVYKRTDGITHPRGDSHDVCEFEIDVDEE